MAIWITTRRKQPFKEETLESEVVHQSVVLLFSPVQLEALELRQSLAIFLNTEKQRIDKEHATQSDAERAFASLLSYTSDPRLRDRYRLDFQEKARIIGLKFSAAGIKDAERFLDIVRNADSCDSLRDLIAALWKMTAEVDSLAGEGAFSALQSDVLHLARDLDGFLKGMGTAPELLVEPDSIRTAQKLEEYIISRDALRRPWFEKLRSSYALKFRRRAEEIYHRLVLAGLSDAHLGNIVQTVENPTAIQELIDLLRKYVMKIEEKK
jgi:hypothetical protein